LIIDWKPSAIAGGFSFKTKPTANDYLSMIVLQPITTEQTLQIVPREFPTLDASFDNVSLTITEDGTGVTQSFTNLTAQIDSNSSNYVTIDASFNILKEGSGYYLELNISVLRFKSRVIEDGGTYESSSCINAFLNDYNRTLWFRDKVYCTSQTSKDVAHTLNTGRYEEYKSSPVGQKYIMR